MSMIGIDRLTVRDPQKIIVVLGDFLSLVILIFKRSEQWTKK
jgi:hypothetical protein